MILLLGVQSITLSRCEVSRGQVHGHVNPAGCVRRSKSMLSLPYPSSELNSTRPWLQSAKVIVSVPHGLRTIEFALKFGIQRPPTGSATLEIVAVLPL